LGRAVTAAGAAPCQKGCDSCCHVPVLISRAEAEGLAAVSKRKLRKRSINHALAWWAQALPDLLAYLDSKPMFQGNKAS
jgi:hypothetical protein